VRIVLVCGFESFNVSLYRSAAARLARVAPHVTLTVFSDRDIASNKGAVAAALSGADAFFGSLLFDYDVVEWLRGAIKDIPVVLVFESALELMGATHLGSFTMDPSGEHWREGGGRGEGQQAQASAYEGGASARGRCWVPGVQANKQKSWMGR
jgi:magnesium chelatase subunit H